MARGNDVGFNRFEERKGKQKLRQKYATKTYILLSNIVDYAFEILM